MTPRQTLVYWLPGIIAGGTAWLAFIALGHTPVIRASGLALVIVGMTLLLRRSGAALAVIGGLALAFSPAFWSQTTASDDVNLGAALIMLAAAALSAIVVLRFSRYGFLALILGFAVFALLFWSQLASFGSLRITTLSAAWLLYLLIDALYLTNPHPHDPPSPFRLQPRHTLGLLILLAVGVINAPVGILLAPAVLLGVLLYHQRLPWWYWLALMIIIGYGVAGVRAEYLSSTWWSYPAAQADAQGLRIPFMLADGWHAAGRWLRLVNLVVSQFTVVGVVLGIFGLSRLARWYPPLGTVTMTAYAAHALFGLVYFGNDAQVLLLPLLMIQIFWMTYAVYVLGEWLQRSVRPRLQILRWLAPAAYVLLPMLLLARIFVT